MRSGLFGDFISVRQLCRSVFLTFCLWLRHAHTHTNEHRSLLSLSLQDFLGQAHFTLGEVVGSLGSRSEKPLGWVCVCLWPPACQYFTNCLANVDGWSWEVDVCPSCQGCFLYTVWNRIRLSIFVLWFSFHIIVNAQKGLISDCLGNRKVNWEQMFSSFNNVGLCWIFFFFFIPNGK